MKKILLFLILVVCSVNCTVFAQADYQELLEEVNNALNNKNYKEVIQVTNKMIKMDSSISDGYSYRANAKNMLCIENESSCNYQSIINDFSLAIKYDNKYNKNYTSALFWGKADAELKLKEYENAIKDYTNSISLCNATEKDFLSLIYYGRAEARIEIDDVDGAISDYTHSIKYNKNNNILKLACYIGRGNAYKVNNEYKKAINDASKVIKLDKMSPSGYFLRGNAKVLLSVGKFNTTDEILYSIKMCESANNDLNIAKEQALLQNDIEYYKQIIEVQKLVNDIITARKELLH